jgi:hypothetical protein
MRKIPNAAVSNRFGTSVRSQPAILLTPRIIFLVHLKSPSQPQRLYIEQLWILK